MPTDFAVARIRTAPVPDKSGTTLVVDSTAVFTTTFPFTAAIWSGGTPTRGNVELVSVTGSNPATGQLTIARAQYGTAALPILAGFQISTMVAELWLATTAFEGFANPMTAIGDMISGQTAGRAGRVAGNTTQRRKWLSQFGINNLAQPPRWENSANFNVRDYGAIGDGISNDTIPLNLARADLVSAGGGQLYFPAGTYNTAGILPVTSVPISLLGDGLGVSTIANTHATNPTLSVTGNGATIGNLKFTTTVNRPNGNPVLAFDGNGADPLVYIRNIQMRTNGDAILSYRILLNIDQSTIKCLAQGGCALHSKSAGLTANSTLFFTIGGTLPPVWIQGTATSLSIANCGVAGYGPRASQVPTSITSDALKFTVTTPVAHTHAVGDWIIISGVTPSAYNGYWRIETVPSSTTFTVATALNPGPATVTFTAGTFVVGQRYQITTVGSTNFTAIGSRLNVVGTRFMATGVGTGTGTASGVVYSVPCSLLIDNELGSVNESQIVATQFGASGYPKDAISAGVYVDGRRGTGTIEGWILGDSYVDLGRVGVLLCGKGSGGGTSVSRWEINSVHVKGNTGDGDSTMLGQVWIEQAPAVTLIGVKNTQADKDPECIALRVYSDGAAPFCDGLIVQSSELGICSNWSGVSGANVAKYGAVFEGTINLLTFADNICWGSTAPVLNTSSVTPSTIVKSSNNAFFTGTVFPTTQVRVPYFSDDGNVPVGGIVPYTGAFADIPTNWHLCDGTGGTVDLTARFILGTNTEADVGDTGGTAQHKHAAGTLAADAASAGTPAGTVNTTVANDTAVTGAGARVTAATFAGAPMTPHTHTISGKTADAEDGGGLTADVLPPWFKLAFIQRMS